MRRAPKEPRLKMAGSNAQLSKNSREPKGLPKPKRRVKTPFHLKFILSPESFRDKF